MMPTIAPEIAAMNSRVADIFWYVNVIPPGSPILWLTNRASRETGVHAIRNYN